MTYWKLERPSKRSGKKWQVRVPTSSGRGKTVAFGDAKMSDYTLHKDKARRENYRTRHQHDRIDDPYAPGFWSWWSLWGESSDLDTAHAAAVKRAKKILGVMTNEEGEEVASKAPKTRRNPNPPGTPMPTMGEVAEVVAALDVPKHLRAEFLKGFVTEWEHAHTVNYDLAVVGSIVLDHLAEDAHYYRKLRRARLNPHAETSPSNRVQACFDALLSLVQEQYPSLSCTIEVDEAAGERGVGARKPSTRAYAFCEDLDDGSFRIAVAGKMNDADDSRVEGLLRHELAHAVLLHGGDLEHTERDADEVAEALFGSPLYYDEDDVQTTDPSAPGARRPRPAYLDDENGRTLDEARPNPYPAGTMHQLETVEDVASCLNDCAAQGDAKTPRMLASVFSQQAKVAAGAEARMLTTLAKAARHCANAIEARLGGEVDRAMASERLCERALADAESPGRKNPKARALFAVKKGDEDWQEQLITEHEDRIEDAKKWAAANGFDRFRIATFDDDVPPDFAGTVRRRGRRNPDEGGTYERALADAQSPGRDNPTAWQKAMRRGTASTKRKPKWKALSIEEVREGTFLLEVDMGSDGIHRITVYPDGFVQSGTARLSPEQQEKARKEVAKRENPEWAKKLGSGLYKGARYAGETARDLYHGAREAHRARSAPPVEGERKNPRRSYRPRGHGF